MTEKQAEQRVLAGNQGICPVCGGSTMQYGTPQHAHRIANTKANRSRWGGFIIDHPMNVVCVCSLRCNDACNIGFNAGAVLELVAEIINDERRRYIHQVRMR